jgi:RNA polymerase sigma-70 factor (ECF subfamily)
VSALALHSCANLAMDRYARGDEEAFAIVYDALAPRLYRFLRCKTQDDAHAEDLVQQTFLQMCVAREAYVTGGDVVPWAFAIARRLAIDSFRKRRREMVSDTVADEESLVAELCPEHALRTKEALLAIHRVLESLPEAQRAAFELLKYDALSLAQAAEVLGTSVTAIKLRVHRTYKALRAALALGQCRNPETFVGDARVPGKWAGNSQARFAR